MALFRSPPSSISRSSNQVSTSDEMPTSVFSFSSPDVRLVQTAVIFCDFRKSIRRVSMDVVSDHSAGHRQSSNRIENNDVRLKLLNELVTRTRGAFPGHRAWTSRRETEASPFLTHRSRSRPMERMLRTICCGDSSNAKYRQRSPRSHAAFTKCEARLLLPEPAVPEISTVLPR